MIISNLNHLEVVAEEISIVGGSLGLYYPFFSDGNDMKSLNYMVKVSQKTSSIATACGYKGDAEAVSTACNTLIITQ